MIVIVDYGMGNLGSIANMLKKIGSESAISSVPEQIVGAGKLILPGVGAFDNGMKNLQERGLIDALNTAVLERKTPVLGICLGMQLLSRRSEEGRLPGLGWIDAETVRFRFGPEQASLKVPHMGWDTVVVRKPHRLFESRDSRTPRFYFVHSFHVLCRDPADVLTETYYGYNFVSSVQHDNIMGVQFHPEKSHRYGLNLLSNFVDLDASRG